MADHNLPDPLRPLGQKLRELGDLVSADVPNLEKLLDRYAEEADGTDAMLAEARETTFNALTKVHQQIARAQAAEAALERVRALAAEWNRAEDACPERCCGSPEARAILEAVNGGTEADR